MRNPLDVVTSMFNFWASQTQNKSIKQTDFHENEKLEGDWDAMVKQEISLWRDFHEFWINDATIPVHFFRYEDLTNDPSAVLTGIFEFVLEQKIPSDSLLAMNISDLASA